MSDCTECQETPEPLELFGKPFPMRYNIVCPLCTAVHTVELDHKPWKCECGALWYLDPAGRLWGTEAITYAHETHGYFGDLFPVKES